MTPWLVALLVFFGDAVTVRAVLAYQSGALTRLNAERRRLTRELLDLRA